MNEVRIEQIPLELFREMWPHVAPKLFKGLMPIDLTIEQVCDDIVRGASQLWAIFSDDRLVAAFLTSLDIDGYVSVYGLGGERVSKWAHALDDAMQKFAADNDMPRVRFSGRAAWSRLLPDYIVTGDHPSGQFVYERAV